MEHEPQNQSAPTPEYSAAEVLAQAAQSAEEMTGEVQRIVIQQATPVHYVGRVFRTGEDEYEPLHMFMEE